MCSRKVCRRLVYDVGKKGLGASCLIQCTSSTVVLRNNKHSMCTTWYIASIPTWRPVGCQYVGSPHMPGFHSGATYVQHQNLASCPPGQRRRDRQASFLWPSQTASTRIASDHTRTEHAPGNLLGTNWTGSPRGTDRPTFGRGRREKKLAAVAVRPVSYHHHHHHHSRPGGL